MISSATVAEHYLRRTVYGADDLFAEGQGTEGGPDEPLKWKVYRGVERFPLDGHLPGSASVPRNQPTLLTDAVLAALLRLTYGFVRWEPKPGPGWPLHRTVASARCLYPTEVYLVLAPQQASLPAGLYHYDPAHHALALLRRGDVRDVLGDAVRADLTDATGALLVSSRFWRTAFKYRNYAYRLCTQEAGLVIGNALEVCGDLGLRPTVHYQFVDRAVNRLPGVEPGEESVLAVVALRPPGAPPVQTRPAPAGDAALTARIARISPRHVGLGRLDRDRCAMVTELDEASYLTNTAAFGREPAAPPCIDPGAAALLDSTGGAAPLDLATAVCRRNSGRVLFTPDRRPVTAAAFAGIAARCTESYPTDLRAAGDLSGAAVHFIVNNVDGVARGVHRWCAEHDGLHQLWGGDPTPALRQVMRVPNVDLGTANIVAFVTADHAVALRAFGDRSYRILTMEAGVLAQRICLRSAGYGLSARIHNGYDPVRAKELLRLADPDITPLFQIVIGHDSPGVRYGMPIWF